MMTRDYDSNQIAKMSKIKPILNEVLSSPHPSTIAI
jgi:hypothetical protein